MRCLAAKSKIKHFDDTTKVKEKQRRAIQTMPLGTPALLLPWKMIEYETRPYVAWRDCWKQQHTSSKIEYSKVLHCLKRLDLSCSDPKNQWGECGQHDVQPGWEVLSCSQQKHIPWCTILTMSYSYTLHSVLSGYAITQCLLFKQRSTWRVTGRWSHHIVYLTRFTLLWKCTMYKAKQFNGIQVNTSYE